MKQRGPLLGLDLTTGRYPLITSQTRYPLRHAASVKQQQQQQQHIRHRDYCVIYPIADSILEQQIAKKIPSLRAL